MVSQKTICLKLDVTQLERLDMLCQDLGSNRNKLINFAVKMLCDNLNMPYECTLVSCYQQSLSLLK